MKTATSEERIASPAMKVWDIFHRDFDVFTATNIQSLRVNAHNRSEALLLGARSLGYLVSELKAYEVVQ